jgi:hypothetical protein
MVPFVSWGCRTEGGFGTVLPAPPHDNPPDLANPVQTDVIVQLSTPKVDILWTIDNSCSMGNEQDELTENIPSFMDYFLGSGLDYHIGVVSTDLFDPSQNGKLQDGGTPYKYIDIDTPDAIGVYVAMASMGTTGHFPEKGIGATYLALETLRDTFNAGFYRDESSLHTIVVSDEQDWTEDSIVSTPEFINWYDGQKLEADERTFSSVVDFTDHSEYENVTEDIGGILWNINEGDFARVLDLLGVQTAGLKREFFLSQLPEPGTIDVNVDDTSGVTFHFVEATGDPLVGDWTYDRSRNSITFLSYLPDELAQVRIRYTILASVQQVEDE